MKTRENQPNKKLSDMMVFIIVVFALILTNITVTSTVATLDQLEMDILQYDSNLSDKELQRIIATLNDDVCDDCDSDDDNDKNEPPIATIFSIEPNPANEFEEILFEGYAEDSDGNVIGYRWESTIDDLISTDASFTTSDLTAGMHTISFFAQDNDFAWSEPFNVSIEIIENQAPLSPIIAGESRGKTGQENEFQLLTSDPEQHDIFYYIEWGDGAVEDWIGAYASNEEVTISHTWQEKGTYTVRAKAKDMYDAESDWGTLEIQMPRSRILQNGILQNIFMNLMQRYPLINQILG